MEHRTRTQILAGLLLSGAITGGGAAGAVLSHRPPASDLAELDATTNSALGSAVLQDGVMFFPVSQQIAGASASYEGLDDRQGIACVTFDQNIVAAELRPDTGLVVARSKLSTVYVAPKKDRVGRSAPEGYAEGGFRPIPSARVRVPRWRSHQRRHW